MSRLLRQGPVVLQLIAGIITVTGWLWFVIAFEFGSKEGLTLGGLLVCLFGMALAGVLSIASRAEGEPHRPRDGATQRSLPFTPGAGLAVVWLSIVSAGRWASESYSGPDTSDRSGWSLACIFADLLTVTWGGFLGQHRAWGWVAGSAVAAATMASVTVVLAHEPTVGDGPYLVGAFVVYLLVLGTSLLVGVSCIAVARSVASVGGGH